MGEGEEGGKPLSLLGLAQHLSFAFHSFVQLRAARTHPTLPRDDASPEGARGGMGQDVSPAGSSQKPPTTLPSYTLENHSVLELEGSSTLLLEMQGQ